jgi:hypothetical protein
VLVADGQAERFNGVGVLTWHPPLPAPGKTMIALVKERQSGTGEPGASAIRRSPPRLTLHSEDADQLNLIRVACMMTGDLGGDHPQWILANRPVVIAIGEHQVTPEKRLNESASWSTKLDGGIELPPPLRLVRQADLDRSVTRLLVLDDWPDRRFTDEQLGQRVRAEMRTLILEQSMSIGDVMRRQLWQ